MLNCVNFKKIQFHHSFYFSADIQVVAVYVKNVGGSGGLIASFGNGVVTDSTWKCTTQGIRNWEKVGFDDNNWPEAKVHSGNSGNRRVYGIANEAKWIGPSLLNAANIYCRRRMSTVSYTHLTLPTSDLV